MAEGTQPVAVPVEPSVRPGVEPLERAIADFGRACAYLGVDARVAAAEALWAAVRAEVAAESERSAPMAARVAASCQSSPGGPYTVTAHFVSLHEAQAAHAWLARLKPPNVDTKAWRDGVR